MINIESCLWDLANELETQSQSIRSPPLQVTEIQKPPFLKPQLTRKGDGVSSYLFALHKLQGSIPQLRILRLLGNGISVNETKGLSYANPASSRVNTSAWASFLPRPL